MEIWNGSPLVQLHWIFNGSVMNFIWPCSFDIGAVKRDWLLILALQTTFNVVLVLVINYYQIQLQWWLSLSKTQERDFSANFLGNEAMRLEKLYYIFKYFWFIYASWAISLVIKEILYHYVASIKIDPFHESAFNPN
jgi:hypothetical protein